MERERIRYVDIARGIAMISIVLGHLGNSAINKVVFTYHLPIFFFISGYFFKEDGSYKTFLSRKWKQLLKPYFFTCVIICALSVPFSIYRGLDWTVELGRYVYASFYAAGDDYSTPFYIKAIGALWFLWATFWGELFLKKLLELKQGTRVVLVFLIFMASIWTRIFFWFPLSIQAGGCALLFIYIGYLFKQILPRLKQSCSLEMRAVFTVMALAMWIWTVRNFKAFWLVHCQIGNGIADIIGSICGCWILIQISVIIDRNMRCISRLLAFFGRYSLLFLAIHITELHWFPYWDVYTKLGSIIGATDTRWLIFRISAALMLISLAMFVLYRLPFIRKVYGYKPLEKRGTEDV